MIKKYIVLPTYLPYYFSWLAQIYEVFVQIQNVKLHRPHTNPGRVKLDSDKQKLWKNVFEQIKKFLNLTFWHVGEQKLRQRLLSTFYLLQIHRTVCIFYIYNISGKKYDLKNNLKKMNRGWI